MANLPNDRPGDWPGKDLAPLALALACVLWGSAFYFAKVALVELSPVEVVTWRFGLAVPALVLVLWRTDARLNRRDAALVVLTGVLCVPVGYLIHFEGLARTSATHAALLVGVGPPLLACAAAAFGLERITRRDWMGVGLACLGVAVMVGLPAASGGLAGDALVLLSMLIATAWVLLSQDLARRLGAMVATAWVLLAGTGALLPVLLVTGAPPVDLSLRTWAALAVLAGGCTIGAFALWNWGASHLPAGRAGVFLNLEPVSGAALGVALLGDPIGPAVVLGGTIVLAAALLVSAGAGTVEVGGAGDVHALEAVFPVPVVQPGDVHRPDRKAS